MLKNILLGVLGLLTIITAVLGVLSGFFFTSRGRMTKKTVIFGYQMLAVFMTSLVSFVSIRQPEIALGAILGGLAFLLVSGLAFAIQYYLASRRE